MKAIIPADAQPLSEEARIVLRHLAATATRPDNGYEYPAVLESLVPDAPRREAALAELERLGYLERAIYPESVPPAIMSCRLTDYGRRYAEDRRLSS